MPHSFRLVLHRRKELTSSQQSRAYALLSGTCWTGTHFDRPRWSVHGSGRVCPGSSGSRSRSALIGILKLLEAVLPGSNPPWRGLGLSPLFRRMVTEAEAFLELPGVSWLRPCARTHLRKTCATRTRLVGRTTNANTLV